MSHPGKLVRSWQLFRHSLRLLSTHPKLLVFPLTISALSVVLCAFFFAVPAGVFILQPTGHSLGQPAHWEALGRQLQHLAETFKHGGAADRVWIWRTAFFLYIALVYLTSMFAATFCNVAFYNEIIKALAGEKVSFRAGIAFACGRFRSILLWSLFAGVVGLVIRVIAERFGWVGRLVMRLIGVAWSVAAVFVIPIIIREEKAGPIELLRLSAATLKKTWGESLLGYIGFSFISGIAVLSSIVYFVAACCLAGFLHYPLLLIPGISLGVLALVVFFFAASLADHIYRCALYIYASEGVVPEPFTAELMDAAWKVKQA